LRVGKNQIGGYDKYEMAEACRKGELNQEKQVSEYLCLDILMKTT
jgi:hypothetical protein